MKSMHVMNTEILKSKYFIAMAVGMLFFFTTQGKAPNGLNYQAVVRNSAGSVLPNQSVNLRFSIHSDSLTGNIRYSETDSVVTSPEGIFTVIIGGGNIIAGSFDSISWATSSFYLQVEMDVTGGNNYLQMGTSQLESVPYSLYARSAGSVDLAPTMYPTINGNDTVEVGSNGYIIITSTVLPATAQVTLTAGTHAGQMLCIAGASTVGNGVRLTTGGTLNMGTGVNNDILSGSTIMLMWSGTQWVQISYSSNQ
jgi:hypothetical protein